MPPIYDSTLDFVHRRGWDALFNLIRETLQPHQDWAESQLRLNHFVGNKTNLTEFLDADGIQLRRAVLLLKAVDEKQGRKNVFLEKGYSHADVIMWLITDFTNDNLRKYLNEQNLRQKSSDAPPPFADNLKKVKSTKRDRKHTRKRRTVPDEAKFKQTDPLDYYYKHGFNLMNPFCRILSENPQYRFILEWRNLPEETDARVMLADSITIEIIRNLKSSLKPKHWDLLELDVDEANSVIKGDAEDMRDKQAKEYRDLGYHQVTLPPKEELLASSRKNARDKLGSLWAFLIETREKLLAASPPTDSWVIRGDTDGMTNYLRTQGVPIPQASIESFVTQFGINWRTNQFFSTSEGDKLASLAGRSLIWLMRINPATTQGRDGGIYTSESEILFPYDVDITLDGGVGVTSENDIRHLNLTLFSDPEALRKKMLSVYRANSESWKSGKARFLVATES